jgi:hypothetical protein
MSDTTGDGPNEQLNADIAAVSRQRREEKTDSAIAVWAVDQGLPEPTAMSSTWTDNTLTVNFRSGDQQCRATAVSGHCDIVRL